MTRWPLTLCAVASLVFVSACGGDDTDTQAPAATLGTVSTTSTTLSVEQEVEAAYLRSWEVFAKAALELDPSGLDEVYAGPALDVVLGNIDRLREANSPVRFLVDHEYSIEVDAQTDLAQVVDSYVNHSVLLDPETLLPTEADPNEPLTETYLMRRIDGTWKVIDISRQ